MTIRLIRHLGSSGIGELIANTLAVRNVTVVVLDVKPIVTENCELLAASLVTSHLNGHSDNITYYKCDVSKWEEVEQVAKTIKEEVHTV